MRKIAIVMTATAALMLAAALPAAAKRLPGSDHGGRGLTAVLTGAAEVPGPGDPDGSGLAMVTVNSGQGEVCWHIEVSDITLPSIGAHIHVGEADAFGGVVVFLSPPDETGHSSGCTTVDRELAKAIRSNPAGYYVNVHTTDFEAGAVRGQLG